MTAGHSVSSDVSSKDIWLCTVEIQSENKVQRERQRQTRQTQHKERTPYSPWWRWDGFD